MQGETGESSLVDSDSFTRVQPLREQPFSDAGGLAAVDSVDSVQPLKYSKNRWDYIVIHNADPAEIVKRTVPSPPSNANALPSPTRRARKRKSVQIRLENEDAGKKRVKQEELERQKLLEGVKRKEPLDLSYASKPNIPTPLPPALATARIIEDLGRVPYPDGVRSPKVELNVNAKDGKFRYDREFLLQFKSICKGKPDMLPPLDAIGIEPTDQASFSMSRGGAGRRPTAGIACAASSSMSSSNPSGGVGLDIPTPLPSALATARVIEDLGRVPYPEGVRSPNVELNVNAKDGKFRYDREFLLQFMSICTKKPDMLPPLDEMGIEPTDQASFSMSRGLGHHGGSVFNGSFAGSSELSTVSGAESVQPLKYSENRWDRKAISNANSDSPEIVDRKVKGLLDKLTVEKFDSISDQIITWANKSEKEKDGRTLIQVIRLVFEKAVDEALWSEMYARLCRKMMEQISPKVQDDGIRNAKGKPITGGQLFRKHLLNRCQEDFERGWVAKADQAAKAANDKKYAETEDVVLLYSDQYYAAQKAKRQGLGLMKFIGELFKLQMLTERIMHECIKKLLGSVENPEEEEIESLCKLLTTVGAILDTNKARAHMDVYFSRMKEQAKSPNVCSHLRFMLQDVIELRDRKWVTTQSAPATIAQIHEAAAKEKLALEKEAYQRQMSMSRGSWHGGDRGANYPGTDEWTAAGRNDGPLSHFGKIQSSSKGLPTTFGPSSVFAGKKDSLKRESLDRSASRSNMFHMLSQNPEAVAEASVTKSSRRTSVVQTGVPEAPLQRRKLILQPRPKPTAEEQQAPPTTGTPDSESAEGSDDDEAVVKMSEDEAKKKIAEDSKEFFGIRNLDEAEVYFVKLPFSHHHHLVHKLVSSAIESKETDAHLVAEFFGRASSKELCSAAAFEEGFTPIVESLGDIVIDAPRAPELMSQILESTSLKFKLGRRYSYCLEVGGPSQA